MEKGRAVYGGINLNHTRTMFGLTMQNNGTAAEAYVTRADNFAPAKVSAPTPICRNRRSAKWKLCAGRAATGWRSKAF